MKQALTHGLPINKPIKSFKNSSALHKAVLRGARPDVVQVLLDAGSDVNCPVDASYPSLVVAAEDGRLDLVKLLLANGADVQARNAMGHTALTTACLDNTPGHENVIKELLAAGAKPTVDDLDSACDSGDPLGPASKRGSPAIVRLLIAAGVDVNGVASWGGPALHRVAEGGNVEVAEVLLALGADPTLRLAMEDDEDYANKTPLDLARRSKAKKIVALLEAAIAGGGRAERHRSAEDFWT
jgi:ankyrin repeat protein